MVDENAPGRGSRSRPAWVIVQFNRHPHRLHLAAIRRAYFRAVVEGRYRSREDVARAAGQSRSTISRFFNGRAISITAALAILDELGLRFDDVATPCDATAEQTNGGQVPARPPD